jgi:hypothetical protein
MADRFAQVVSARLAAPVRENSRVALRKKLERWTKPI